MPSRKGLPALELWRSGRIKLFVKTYAKRRMIGKGTALQIGITLAEIDGGGIETASAT